MTLRYRDLHETPPDAFTEDLRYRDLHETPPDAFTEDQAERLIKELSIQLDRINDHLNGIERALSFMAENMTITEFKRDRP